MSQESGKLYQVLWSEYNNLSDEDKAGEKGKAIQLKIAQRQRCSNRYVSGIKTPIRG